MPGYASVQCFLAEEVGTRAYLRVFWGDSGRKDCLVHGYHDAHVLIGESDRPRDWSFGGRPETYPDEQWPTACDHCGAPVPPISPNGPTRQVFRNKLYRANGRLYTPPDNGYGDRLPPGAMFWADWHEHDGRCSSWDDCGGLHLHVVLPNGAVWDVDGRASNCDMPQDRKHRCWRRHGEVPMITVDKAGGPTCHAGAGSIASGDYHGFLQNGWLTAG